MLDHVWSANWITHPEIKGEELGVYLFKKVFSLPAAPEAFLINISADNRYKLYVNKKLVCSGPARGNLLRWRYETVDIAPFLEEGNNSICVKVWNFGTLRPMAQFSHKTGLIICGHTAKEAVVNTNQNWKVMIDAAYTFYPIENIAKYYVTGPGENFTCSKHTWAWQDSNFEDTEWLNAKELDQGNTLRSIGVYGNIPAYALYPSEIPLMESKKQYFSKIRKFEGIENVDALLDPKISFVIPANHSVSILLDQGVLTNAYTQLIFSKGKDSQIKITYAESLFHTEIKDGKVLFTKHKGNRDVITGKKIKGHYDTIICDGGINRFYEPLWWRTFRYVKLEIITKDQPLEIEQFYSLFTGYPLVQKATFNTNNPLLAEIFKVGWRTQRLCAGETFFDCPYYEQLQYIGDCRVQGLVVFYTSGDTLLWRKSIIDFYDSILPFGITQSRYPSFDPQLIPTFSLVWITMLWDYMMHCDDCEFIHDMLPAVLNILQWFENRKASSGLLGKIEGWNFVDWVDDEGWNVGVPPIDEGGESAIIGLQYVYTIQKAVDLFAYFDKQELVNEWQEIGNETLNAILRNCWCEEQNLLADTAEKRSFSQHANILVVLVNAFSVDKQRDIIQRVYNNPTLAQCSYYYKFYLLEAIKKTNLGVLFVEVLLPWADMLQNGLTTFMEEPEPSRSDCHAWSASPLYYFFSLICGIETKGPNFNEVNIRPSLGELEWIEAKMPHRQGLIIVKLMKIGKEGIKGEVILPDGLTGYFYWNDTKVVLDSGHTDINEF